MLKISKLQFPPLHSHCNNHKQTSDYRLSFESSGGPQTLCRARRLFFTAQSPPPPLNSWTLERSSEKPLPVHAPSNGQGNSRGPIRRAAAETCPQTSGEPTQTCAYVTQARARRNKRHREKCLGLWEGCFALPPPFACWTERVRSGSGSECRSSALIRRRFSHTRWQSWEDGWKKIERPCQLREVLRLMRLFALHWHIFCTCRPASVLIQACW